MAVILSPRGNEASKMMKRFVRYEEAAQYFGIDETLIVAYAKAAGAVYQLSKIRLISVCLLSRYLQLTTLTSAPVMPESEQIQKSAKYSPLNPEQIHHEYG